MKIQDNFTDTHLLFSTPVSFTIYDDSNKILLSKFKLNLPTVQDIFFEEEVSACLSFLKQSAAELFKKFGLNLEPQSHFNLIRHLIILSSQLPEIAIFWSRIFNGLVHLCPLLIIKDCTLYIQGAEVNDELFERMRDIWLIAIGNKTYSKAYQYMTPEQRAMEEKIQAIKSRGKSNQGSSTSFEKFYMILTYEFGYTREEILKMTMHAVNVIIKYTSKSINYKLTLAAKAYGNTKKVKFITDQGD